MNSENKVCTSCKQEKSLSEFQIDRRSKSGLQNKCKSCRSSHQKTYYETTKYRHPWFKQTLKIYGLSQEDFDNFYRLQGGCCAICANPIHTLKDESTVNSKKLCIDHNHATGTVRGLLCLACNSAIGYLGDNVSLLYKAADYLQRHTLSEDSDKQLILETA